MKKIISLIILISIAMFHAGLSSAADEPAADMKKESFLKVMEKILGKDQKVVRIEDQEDSPIRGLRQIRVWFESVYGETPVLFYATDDGSMVIAGSIFDAEGNNLTKKTVGVIFFKPFPSIFSFKKPKTASSGSKL